MQHPAPARTVDSMTAQNQTDPHRYGIIHAARIDFANAYATAYAAQAGEAGKASNPTAYTYATRAAPVYARELIKGHADIAPALHAAPHMGADDAALDYSQPMPN